MKLFRNFKTKKQLREEIKKLETCLIHQHMERNIFSATQKTIETIRCSVIRRMEDVEIPDRIFENEIVNNFTEQIRPFIDFETRQEPDGGIVYTGTLSVLRIEGRK